MFRHEGWGSGFVCAELEFYAHVEFYIWDDLEEWKKEGLAIIVPDASHVPNYCEIAREQEILVKTFDHKKARDMRLINLGKQCKEIGVNIPIDPRFID